MIEKKQMKDRIFLDSNILIYSIDNQKSKIVETIINSDCEIFISTQVVNEFINVCFKKKLLGFNNTLEASKKFMSSFNLSQISENTIYKAFEIKDNYKYSYYDCLIISSALENNCDKLLSEDLHHSQKIENSLFIVNPFMK